LQEQYWANHYTQQQQDSVLIDLANQVRLCIEQVDHGIRHLDRYACSSKPQPEIIAIHKPQETEIQPSLISKPPSTNNQSPNLLIINPSKHNKPSHKNFCLCLNPYHHRYHPKTQTPPLRKSKPKYPYPMSNNPTHRQPRAVTPTESAHHPCRAPPSSTHHR